VFNATFSNISAISWRPVLVVEEAGVLGENNRPWIGQATGKLYHLEIVLNCKILIDVCLFVLMVFYTIFNNISVISWW
jgi:hypothetical protein